MVWASHRERQQWVVLFIAGIGGFLFGYDTGVISGALDYMGDDLYPHATPVERATLSGVVVSAAIWAAAAGAISGGRLADMLGRKRMMGLADTLFIAGSLCMALSGAIWLVVVGRVFVGLAIGVASVTVPVYLAETAQAGQRAQAVGANVLMITTGMLLSYMVNYGLSFVPGTWRWMLGVAALPALLQLVGLQLLPESPRWLLSKGHTAKSKAAAERLFSPTTVSMAMESMDQEVHHVSEHHATVFALLRNPITRSQLHVGVALQVLQQLGGINTVMYFLPILLKAGGVQSTQQALLYSCFPAAVNAFGSIVGMRFIERAGRRSLVLGSLGGVVLTLGMLSVSFKVADLSSPSPVPVDARSGLEVCSAGLLRCADCLASQCHFCLDKGSSPAEGWCLAPASESLCLSMASHVPVVDGCPSPWRPVIVGVIMAYLLAFSIGLGPVPWAINAEIYPVHVRGVASGVAGTANWLTNGAVSQTFLLLITALRASGAFALYACIAAGGLMWALLFVPETKGLSLEEVQQVFVRRVQKRRHDGIPPCASGDRSREVDLIVDES